jgi:hypothetical protein
VVGGRLARAKDHLDDKGHQGQGGDQGDAVGVDALVGHVRFEKAELVGDDHALHKVERAKE